MNKTTKQALVLDNEFFFAEVLTMLAEGHRVTLKAKGWSMLPLIWDERDKITLAPTTPESYALGRIVLARLGDHRYVVHRIAEIKGDRFTLRGDGNPYQIEICHRSQIVGELVAIERNGKPLRLGSMCWQCFRRLWPRHGFSRRCLLFAYRRLFTYPYLRRQGFPLP